jgi:hypothetical protein
MQAIHLDSLAQFCGLSLPTFTLERIGNVTNAGHRIDQNSSRASNVSTAPKRMHSLRDLPQDHGAQRKPVDLLTGYCGSSLPAPFKRIGSMAAPGQPFPTRFFAGRLLRVRPPELVLHAGNPTPTGIASGPAERLAAAIRMKVGKPSRGPINGPSVRPCGLASLLARRAYPGYHLSGRKPMSARAGPFV